MFHVVLVNPEIPPNTGNIIRLCANTGCSLHLIEPLGFPLDSARMRRAGLDYHEFAEVKAYRNWEDFLNKVSPKPEQLHAFTTKTTQTTANSKFKVGDYLVFGSETSGMPEEVRKTFLENNRWRLPMKPNNRSLNLSNSVAIIVYEAWRQNGFEGGL